MTGTRCSVLALVALCGCAPLPSSAPSPPVAAPPRAADDADLRAVVPAPAEVLLWVNMALLRESSWARPLLAASSPDERAARAQERGFDDLQDVDLWVLAKSPGQGFGAAHGSLEVLQGRFDQEKVRRAFLARRPQAREQALDGARSLEDGETALAFVTARTLVLGPPAGVRAAVAAAWRRGPAARDERWLGEVTAALEDEVGRRGRGAALELAVEATDEVRAQLREALGPEGESITRLGARVILGQEARAAIVASASDRRAAATLGRALETQALALRRRRSIAALGLRPVLEGLGVSVRGARVVAALAVSEGDREQVAERLATLAELLKKAP